MSTPKIVEVAFDDYVRRPENQHNTNVLRAPEGRENEIGPASLVDTLEEDASGIVATKVHKGKLYRSRYPWSLVKDVKYAPLPVEEPVLPEVSLPESVDLAPMPRKSKVA